MLTLKLITSSMRGVPAIISNQAGIVASTSAPASDQHHPIRNLTISGQDSRISQNYRHLSASSVYQQASTTPRTSKHNKVPPSLAEINLPEKPKKPVTPWISFVRERKDDVLRQRGKISAAELAVILAQEWKQTDKTKYEQEYKQMHDEYMKLVENYEKSLTPDQLDLIEYNKSAKRESKASKMLRKTNPPVLPRNPANLYCHERSKHDDFKEMLKHKKAAQVFSDIFREYRELSEAEKKKYLDMQEEDKIRYQHEFLEWYESVQTNENLTKAAREQANMMRERLRALNYI